MGLKAWINKHILRRRKEDALKKEVAEFNRRLSEVKLEPKEDLVLEKWRLRRDLPKPGQQAVQKGYGKFFKGKGKHQTKQYRQSVKARKQPAKTMKEED